MWSEWTTQRAPQLWALNYSGILHRSAPIKKSHPPYFPDCFCLRKPPFDCVKKEMVYVWLRLDGPESYQWLNLFLALAVWLDRQLWLRTCVGKMTLIGVTWWKTRRGQKSGDDCTREEGEGFWWALFVWSFFQLWAISIKFFMAWNSWPSLIEKLIASFFLNSCILQY